MQPKSDVELLRDYAEHASESAFSEFVSRYTNLVYSAALRQVGSAEAATEVVQEVFIGIARGAPALLPRLTNHASLAGWLCRSARNVALNHRRAEIRRLTRERLAMDDPAPTPEFDADWEHLRLVLDDAMAGLSEADYDAVVLRFYQNQDYRAVGRALGVSDDTAQKRVSRALERLHQHLAQRGITTTAVALAAALSANAVSAAPAGLAATLCAGAIGAAVTGSAVTATMTTAAAAAKTIAMTVIQKTIIAAALVASVGAAIYATHQSTRLRTGMHALQDAVTARDGRLAELQAENERLARAATPARDSAGASADTQFRELLTLRGKAQLDAREIAELKALIARNSGRIPEPVAQVMNHYLAQSIEQEKQWQKSTALSRAKRLAGKLGIEPAQEPALREALLASAESRALLEMAHSTGTVGPDTVTPEKIVENEANALASVLSPEQMETYRGLIKDDLASKNRAWVSFEAGKMKKDLGLTPEQAAQVSVVLAQLKPGEGGEGTTYYANSREQMEIRMRALDAILTPQQSAIYRKIKEDRMVEKAEIAVIVAALEK